MLGDKVEFEYGIKKFTGRITKVLNKDSCVVSWQYKDNRGFHQHNKLYLKSEIKEARGVRI